MKRCRPFITNKLLLAKDMSSPSKHSQTHHSDDPRLPGDALRTPRKVARVETKCTEFGVPTTGAHGVDALNAKLGVGRLTAEFELALLAVVGTLGTGSGTLMP